MDIMIYIIKSDMFLIKNKNKKSCIQYFSCNKNMFIIPACQKIKVLCRRLYTEGNCHDMYK